MKLPVTISAMIVSFYFITGGLCAQSLSVGLMGGYASFAMEDLKAYQRGNVSASDLPLKVVDEFPGYLFYRADFSLNTNKGLFEAFIGHTSTGGRIHYSDYSGYSSQKIQVKMTYLGASAATRLIAIGSFEIYAGGRMLHYFNTMKHKVSEEVYNSILKHSVTIDFKSMSLGISPMVQVRRKVQRFLFKADVGYEFHIPGKLYYGADSDIPLKTFEGDEVKVDPTGFRIGVGVGYSLF